MDKNITDEKSILFIRHGESFQNTFSKERAEMEKLPQEIRDKIIDSDITDLGKSQAEEAKQQVKDSKVDLVFTSPMYRTLRTTQLVFKDHPSSPKIIVLPYAREIFFGTHDIPREVSKMKFEFPDFDFSLIDSLDEPNMWLFQDFICPQKKESFFNSYSLSEPTDHVEKIFRILKDSNNFYNESKMEIAQRCLKLKDIIEKELDKGKNLAIVSHAYFISTFIADEIDQQGNVKERRRINNCEVLEFSLNKFSIKF